MHWAVILTNLVLALISAGLVFLGGWEPWQALLTVAASALGIALAVLGIILLFARPEERGELLRVVRDTMRQDLDDMLRYFRIRRR